MRRCARAHSVLLAVRETTPLISCITNSVAAGFTADVLLASGAAPAMVDITGEAGTFAAAASGLLINLGTPQPEQRAAAREAADTLLSNPIIEDVVSVAADEEA